MALEHLRAARRARQASGSDQQPAAAARGHRRAHPTWPPDYAAHLIHTRPLRLGAAGAQWRCQIPAQSDRCCGAVDGRPEMVTNPGPRCPSMAQGSPAARSTASDGPGVNPADCTQKLNRRLKIASSREPTAVFWIIPPRSSAGEARREWQSLALTDVAPRCSTPRLSNLSGRASPSAPLTGSFRVYRMSSDDDGQSAHLTRCRPRPT